MSDVTAVPLRPIAKGSLTKLWAGIALLAIAGAGAAWIGTSDQVALATPPQVFLEKNANKSGIKVTPSGLQYEVIEEGTGPNITVNDLAVVDYDGQFLNGKSFDRSADHGGASPMPVAGMIPGWTEGLQLMKSGSKYRFWMPPALAYGERGVNDPRTGELKIPGNSVLVFDVKIEQVIPNGAAMMAGMGGGAGAHGGAPTGAEDPAAVMPTE
jgi:FKBP-type peptidyl-prolyl cis-trans isomerase FkpA